jgi:hypothetical protein
MHMKLEINKVEWRYNGSREDGRQILRWMVLEDYPDDEHINFMEFIAWLTGILHSMPPELGVKAHIKLAREDYECGTAADFEIFVDRVESDEEYAGRQSREGSRTHCRLAGGGC